VERFWDYLFLHRCLAEVPSPRSVRVAELAAQVDGLKVEVGSLRDEVVSLREQASKSHKILQSLESKLVDGTDPSPTRVSDTIASKATRAPPAPFFCGSKEGYKVQTWLEQFSEYCRVMRIEPALMTSYATLCLKDKAAEHWSNIKQGLLSVGKDPYEFDVFKLAMLEHYVDLSVESTVRSRLSSLRQTQSVAEFLSEFRDIMVEAVLHPLSNLEATTYFRAGLKKSVYEHIMCDSSVRHEGATLESVVRAAKEAEALISLLEGRNSDDNAHSPEFRQEPRAAVRNRPSSLARDQADDAKRPRTEAAPKHVQQSGAPASLVTQAAAWGIPKPLVDSRFNLRKCIKCGTHGHAASACPVGIVIPAKTGP
jgi:hypothetical protein